MSTQPNAGGPAFPGAYFDRLEGIGEVRREQYHGMTLRDYFAAAALQGMIACPLVVRIVGSDGKKMSTLDEGYSACAYSLADAMLAARTKGQS